MLRHRSPLLVLVLVSLWPVMPRAGEILPASDRTAQDPVPDPDRTGEPAAGDAPETAGDQVEGPDPYPQPDPNPDQEESQDLDPDPVGAQEADPRIAGPMPDPATPPVDDTPCDEPGSEGDAFIDRVQRGVYYSICGATDWFDGLFGNPRYDQDSDETYGRIGLFQYYDRRDDFDTRLRLRARFALPALEERMRLTIGRGSRDDLLEERPSEGEAPLPSTFRNVEDEGWLLGLGYRRQGNLTRGFDFGVGMRLSTPVDPYVKGTYRHNFVLDNRTMFRFRETLFWRDSRGFGALTQLTLDRLLTNELMYRWNNVGVVSTRKTEGLDWSSTMALYQRLSPRRGLSYAALVRGETSAEVPLQNYGVETRYRQQIFRRWLFMELSASLTWPREFLEEERKINPGVGIGFEMYFGPVPEAEMN